jgi:hypothetical protein
VDSSHAGVVTEKNCSSTSTTTCSPRTSASPARRFDPGVPRALFGLPSPSIALNHGFYNRFAVSADGQRFLLSQPGTGGPTTVGGLADTIAAVVDRGGTGSTGTTNAVKVVLNWTQMFKKK